MQYVASVHPAFFETAINLEAEICRTLVLISLAGGQEDPRSISDAARVVDIYINSYYFKQADSYCWTVLGMPMRKLPPSGPLDEKGTSANKDPVGNRFRV